MQRQMDIQLEKLKKMMIEMSSIVENQVELTFNSVKEGNNALAEKVIELDNEVDKYDVKIEKLCQRIFALNQPYAMDLRFIMSAFAINNNLERIGDIAVNISERAISLISMPDFIEGSKFFEMAEVVKTMIKNSIDSYIRTDAVLAKKVIATDDKLDDLNSENCIYLKELMKKDSSSIEEALKFFVISRQIERMGDHCTNIAENVYFIVEAQSIKHKFEKQMFLDEEE